MAPSWWKAPLLLLGSVFLFQSIITSESVPKPGEIVVLNITNDSISLEWGQPSNVNNTQYNFNVTYNSDDERKTITTENNSIKLNSLASGTSYTVKVVTINVNDTASDPVVKNIFTAPNPVSNVTVSHRNTTSITLSWNQPFGNTSEYMYKVVLSDNLRTKVTADLFIVFMNLSPGTEYTFSVFTLVAENTSAGPVNISTATVPSKPGAIIVTDVSNSSISLSLGNPANMTINQFYFNISYGIASDRNNSLNESSNFTTIQDLQSGTNYTISVTTVIPAGVESEAVVLSQFTNPNPPGPITVTNFNNSFISLIWGAPMDMDNGSYTFKITYTNGSAEIFMTVNSTSTIIPNLVSGTNYTICVATIGPGELLSECVSTFQVTKPNVVSNIQIVKVDNNSVTLNWTRPIEYKDDYSYLVLTKESLNPVNPQNVTVNIENATLTDLTPGINNTFTIITLVANVKADGVEISSYTQPEKILEADINVNNDGTVDKLSVSWKKPAGNVEMYFIVVEDMKNSEKKIERTNVTSTVTFRGLRPGRVYNVSVITNSGPFNVTSGNVQGITVPNIPGAISVVDFNTSFISLNWGAPANMDDGCCSFNITYTNGSTTETVTAQTNFTIIGNLISGTEYTIYVATVGPGQLISQNQSIKHFTKPNPIQNLQIRMFGTSNISLEWTRPQDYKAEYKYRVVTEGSPAPTNGNGNKTTIEENVIVGGLTSGTNYNFSVTTLAADGTPAESVEIANYTKPVKIPSENITLSNENTTDTLKVSWILPPGGVENFTVEIKDGRNPGAYNKANTVGHSVTELVFSDLRPGRLYNVTVATISGPHHITSDEVFEATIPSPPRNIEVTNITNSSLQFKWDRPENMDIGEYAFIVSYQTATPPNSNHFSQGDNNSTISNLASGTMYTITVLTTTVFTTIPVNLTSTIIRTSSYTKPNPIQNLQIRMFGTSNISLEWTRPQDYKAEYKYRVVTEGSPAPTNGNGNKTTIKENVIVGGLTSGTNYNFSVTTLAADGTPAESVEIANYTKPVKIPSENITLSNENTTDTLKVSWILPPGGVENFTVEIKDGRNPGAYNKANTVGHSVTELVFSDLRPGRLYNVTVATISGPHHITSDEVFEATIPSPPRNIEVTNITNSSLQFKWDRPENMDIGEYAFIVSYQTATPPNSNHFSQGDNNSTISNLASGTMYTITVLTTTVFTTIPVNLTSTIIRTSSYTKPNPIQNLQIRMFGTSNISLEWTRPQDYKAEYKYRVVTEGSPAPTNGNGNKTTIEENVIVGGLTSGTNYNFSVTTLAADGTPAESVEIANYTKPVKIPSENITLSNENTTDTLKVSWILPPGGVENFTVEIKDGRNPGAYNKANTVGHSVTELVFSDLRPGRLYNVTVATISGPHHITSDEVFEATKPNPVKNFRVSETNSTSINLTWDQPAGYQSEYNYMVQTNGETSSGQVVSDENLLVDGLNSGDNFTFTIITLAADGTQSNPVSLSQCTDAAAINSSSLSCKGVNRKPVLNLTWACPSGLNTGFTLQAKQNFDVVINGTSAACISNRKHQYNLSNVEYSTNYIVSITTLSCGSPSTPVSIDCTSGITLPPQPLNKLELLNLDVTHNSVRFSIRREAFNSTSGPILTVAVIVTKDESENAPNAKDLATAFSPGIFTYVTQVIELQAVPQNTRVDAQTDPISINVGDNIQSMGYINQELTPLTGYRFSLAGFTRIEYNEEKKIDTNKSLYSTYEYSRIINLKQDPGVIIGAVVGTILGALVIITLAILLIWWKKRTKSNNKNLTQLPIPNMSAINVDYFEGYFSKQHADSDCGFAEEYEELKTVGTMQSTQVSQQPLNKPKNRYNNVLPYDNSRVKLSVTSDPSSDYINANFMPGYQSKKEFIAAQGPLMNTVSDFWRMIWDQRVPAIVMLTKCVEQGRAKCEQYWPTERPLIFEDKIVTLTSEVIYQDWTIRDFSLVKDKSGEKYHVKQFHFTGWPDHGVPSTTRVLIEFRNLVRNYINQHPLSGPTVVHCSAGVGRTGTFISIDDMIQQIDNNRKVDIWGTVFQLRMNRPLMVQTESQYVFLNQCAMEYIKSSKQYSEEAIYENAPALIYENTSAIRAAQASNGHIL
ncbi:receptor-type tyrosine-protein phosphatase eta [Rhinoraja longicauda]